VTGLRIRGATAADAEGCAAVYRPYVTDSCISFEYEPPTAEDFAGRIAASHAWLVAEDEGRIVGYAYASRHRDRAAYDWAADVAIYTDASHHGRGMGRRLYEELFPRLRAAGLRVLCAGIALPNDASEGLHRALGFEDVGVYRRIGWKGGRWHDVRWLQLHLGDDAPPATVQG